MTHADKIRSMTDEELAYILMAANGVMDDYAKAAWLDWLKQEVQDDTR